MAKTKKTTSAPRRQNGTGSIFQCKNGLWAGKIWVKKGNGEKIRKTIYGHSETEVANKLLKLGGKVAFINSTDKTFSELFLNWLLIVKKNSVKDITLEGNIQMFNKYIKPYTADLHIDEFTSDTSDFMINQIFEKNLSNHTAKKLKDLLNQFFKYAIGRKLVSENPIIYTKKIIIREDNKYKAIHKEDRKNFLEALTAKGEILKPFCYTMMFSGLRTGEALALTWEDIDFENGTMTILKALSKMPKINDSGITTSRKFEIGATKNDNSKRMINIPYILLEELKSWREHQKLKSLATKIDLVSPKSLIFCNDDGSLRTYAGMRSILERFKASYDISNNIHFHTLRHTFATMLFEQKENPKIVQGLLGHSTVKTTMIVYNNSDSSYCKEAMNRFDEYVSSNFISETKKEKNDNNITINSETIASLESLLATLKAGQLK